MLAMETINATKAVKPVVREKKFKVTIMATVRDDNTQRDLIRPEEHTYIVVPPEEAMGSKDVLNSKCDLLAREQFSQAFWKRLETETHIADRLEGREWIIFTKATKILPLF